MSPADSLDKTGEPVGKTSLRPVTVEDEALLFEIYCNGRAQEIASVPWPDAQKEAFLRMQFTAQTNHYRDYYSGSEHNVILLDNMPIGRVQVTREQDRIEILDITILEQYRGLGIGTPIIKEIMDRAAAAHLPVTIHVETFNPSVSLFRRLGFVVKQDDGVNLLFQWEREGYE